MKILNDILEARKGHYVHAVEVSSAYELEEFTAQLFDEFRENYEESEILEFFNSISVYCLDDDNKEEEEKIHNFNFGNFIKELV